MLQIIYQICLVYGIVKTVFPQRRHAKIYLLIGTIQAHFAEFLVYFRYALGIPKNYFLNASMPKCTYLLVQFWYTLGIPKNYFLNASMPNVPTYWYNIGTFLVYFRYTQELFLQNKHAKMYLLIGTIQAHFAELWVYFWYTNGHTFGILQNYFLNTSMPKCTYLLVQLWHILQTIGTLVGILGACLM